jgi:hypothetical protein
LEGGFENFSQLPDETCLDEESLSLEVSMPETTGESDELPYVSDDDLGIILEQIKNNQKKCEHEQLLAYFSNPETSIFSYASDTNPK